MRISKTLLLCTVALAGMTVPMKNALADVKPNSIPANPSMKQDASKPVVVSTNVDGEPDVQTTGVAVFDPVKITVNTDHFTNDNLLTPDGLGWTEDTEVQIIKGHEVGEINNQKYWGQNNPQEPTIAYSFAKGDSGRITYVGKTLSGVDLDLIYTIENTDADLWEQYSGLNRIKVPRGIAFTGEQYLANTNNNSIVVLYNGANSVHLKYQIVKHDSFDEIPVLVSFITTDIDVGQGVATDLPNLAAVVPGTTNLSFQDGVVYDGSHTGPYHYGADINGSEGLPYGGYLGVSFQSHFNYAFFAPAPANDDIYRFATGVRYDLFGSALQTKLIINRQAHVKIRYVDTKGNELQPIQTLKATNEFPMIPAAPKITGYELKDTDTKIESPLNETVTHTYAKNYVITIRRVDEQGKELAPDRKITVLEGSLVELKPEMLSGYKIPQPIDLIAEKDEVVKLVYQRQPIVKPSVDVPKPKRQTEPQSTQSESKPNIQITKPNPSLSFKKEISVIKQPSLSKVQSYQVVPVHNNTYRTGGTWLSTPYVSPRVQVGVQEPPKHVNRQVRKHRKINWFYRNTGINKNDRKVLIKVLKGIESEGKKRGWSKEKIKTTELYYIANIGGYGSSGLQVRSSDVEKYTEKSLKSLLKGRITKEEFKTFSKIINNNHSSKNKTYVDLSHLAITAASARDQGRGNKFLQKLSTTPIIGFIRYGKWITKFLKPIPNVKMRWLLINGFLGDALADWKISKPDKYADLDVFKFANSNQLMSRQLQQIYGQTSGNLANQRNQTQKSISGDVIRTAALTSVATLGLFALGVFKKAKELVIGAYNESKKLRSRILQGYNKYVVKPVAKFRRKIYNRGVKMVRQIKRAAVKTYRRVQKFVSRPYNRVKRAVRKTYRKVKSVVHRVVKSVKKFFKRRR